LGYNWAMAQNENAPIFRKGRLYWWEESAKMGMENGYFTTY